MLKRRVAFSGTRGLTVGDIVWDTVCDAVGTGDGRADDDVLVGTGSEEKPVLGELLADGTAVSVADGIAVSLPDGIMVTVPDGIVVSLADGIMVTVPDGIAVSLADGIMVTLVVGDAVSLADGIVVTLVLGNAVVVAEADGVPVVFRVGNVVGNAVRVAVAETVGRGVRLADGDAVMLAEGVAVTLDGSTDGDGSADGVGVCCTSGAAEMPRRTEVRSSAVRSSAPAHTLEAPVASSYAKMVSSVVQKRAHAVVESGPWGTPDAPSRSLMVMAPRPEVGGT
jgi:hypothetical protein